MLKKENLKHMSKNLIYGTDDDFLACHRKNKVYKMYELFGIYERYSLSSAEQDNDFEQFYLGLQGTTEWHFCNKGIQYIHRQMGSPRFLAKRNMRRFCRTYRGMPIVFTYYASKIIEKLLNLIYENEDVYLVYERHIMQNSSILQHFIDFQNDVIVRFNGVGGNVTVKQKKFRELYREMKQINWRREP